VLKRIARGANEILEGYGCAIYRLEEDGLTLAPLVVIDPLFEQEILATQIDVDNSFTGQAVKARRGLIFNEAGPDPSGYYIPGTQPEPEECVIAAPFIVDDQVVGAMCLSRIGVHFTPEDLALAETFAAYASVALKNAQAHDRLQLEVEDRRRAEALLEERNLALRASEERYRGLFEDSPISLWVEDFSAVKAGLDELRQAGVRDLRAYLTDRPEEVARLSPQIRVLEVNRRTVELYRASSKDELLGSLDKVIDPDSLDSPESILAVAGGKGADIETTNCTLNGERSPSRCWSVTPG
jgi:GAF domain-containing protein